MRRTRVVEPLLSAALALVALGAALVSQHRFDMQPCPWCVLQRLLFAVGAALALLEATTLTLAGGRGDGDAWQSGNQNGQWPLAAPLLAGLHEGHVGGRRHGHGGKLDAQCLQALGHGACAHGGASEEGGLAMSGILH